jgi:hypothetical protein
VRGFKQSLQALIAIVFAREQFHDFLEALNGLGLQRVLNKNLRLHQEIFERLAGANIFEKYGRWIAAFSARSFVGGRLGSVSRGAREPGFQAVQKRGVSAIMEQVDALLVPGIVWINVHKLFERLASACELIVGQSQIK